MFLSLCLLVVLSYLFRKPMCYICYALPLPIAYFTHSIFLIGVVLVVAMSLDFIFSITGDKKISSR